MDEKRKKAHTASHAMKSSMKSTEDLQKEHTENEENQNEMNKIMVSQNTKWPIGEKEECIHALNENIIV